MGQMNYMIGVVVHTTTFTPEPIPHYYVVHWYVNGVYAGYTPGANEGEENGPTEASCYFKVGEGSLTGTTYTKLTGLEVF